MAPKAEPFSHKAEEDGVLRFPKVGLGTVTKANVAVAEAPTWRLQKLWKVLEEESALVKF